MLNDAGVSCKYREWLDSFATKTYELGLHKRVRNYHVTLSWMTADGKKHWYETSKLSSLRLPGKELAIVAGKWNSEAPGETQALIDSIEITRVSQ